MLDVVCITIIFVVTFCLIKPSDKIDMIIHRQLIDNKSKYNNLNDTLFFKTSDFKNSVEIHHENHVNKTHLFDVKEKRNKPFQKA